MMGVLLASVLVASSEPAAPRVLALVVGSNASSTPGRSRLSYADDDAAKDALLFENFAARADITLLTDFDADTERLFGAQLTPTGKPTVAEVDAALSRWVQLSHAQPPTEPLEFFFVFAGHGDIDRGQGIIELADGPYFAEQLKAHLTQLAPHRVHLLLDSCNSFFMLTPRKAGGKRYATSDDVVQRFKAELAHVGVVLSTSAENEVYEWSDLQSGVFSHLVRSAALGLADADRDGVIAYDELFAFLTLATRTIANPAYRPKVFVRGPDGGRTPLFRLRGGRKVSVTLSSATALSLRSGEGLRWADANLEAGRPLTLFLSPSTHDWELRSHDSEGNTTVTVPRDPSLEATPTTASATSRGLGALEGLFALPFGEHALGAFLSEPVVPQVFGLSRSEAKRLQGIVKAFAASEAEKRLGYLVAGGVGLLTTASATTAQLIQDPSKATLTLVVGANSLAVTGGILAWELGRIANPERLTALADGLTREADPSNAMLALDKTVAWLRRVELANRRREITFNAVLLSGAVTLFAISEVAYGFTTPEQRAAFASAQWLTRLSLASAIFSLTGAVLVPIFGRARRDFFDLWSADPAVEARFAVSVIPLPGGAMASLQVQLP